MSSLETVTNVEFMQQSASHTSNYPALVSRRFVHTVVKSYKSNGNISKLKD